MARLRIAVLVAGALSLGGCAYGEVSFAKFSAKHQGVEILPVAFVKQQEPADCGAAALTSVGRFWGAAVAEGSILAQAGPENPRAGYSIGELDLATERLGLASSRLLENPTYMLRLVDAGVPVIAPIAKPYERRDFFDFMLASLLSNLIVKAFVGDTPTVNHYVVVLGADERLFYVLDPQDGYRAIARDEFLDHWRDLTLKFVPDAGANVAAFAVYREAPTASSDATPAVAFTAELAGYHDGALGGGAWTAYAR